ncbi:hypothetical protein BP6252_07396 [Coleophoma cylindrospora]|uniref:Zn(2)-C6 fungal-type domain-containing protein n=1 Tax=Coleophoma cylindrospora TaxID=1849047 RepID=A0A3D8RHG1_9HELO|nr:hypothetical protein BP6252_07396 [Coleophoma cylindrospora]
MTLPVACPPANSELPTVPQRKRRRRAPASGASDDCFTCNKRNTKCDRRRPYCSQCLEIGKECSGYKTQLTWGVGVASRGKLRGLSLPVARSAPAHRSPPPPTSRPRSTSTITKLQLQDRDDVKIKTEPSNAVSSISAFTNYDFVNMAPNGPNPPMPMQDWNMSIANEYSTNSDFRHESGIAQQRQLPQLQRLHTLSLSRDGIPVGLGPHSPVHDAMSVYAESDYAHSPISQSFPNDDAPYLNSPVPMYNFSTPNSTAGHSPVVGHIGMLDSRGPTSMPEHYYAQSDMSSSLSSHQTIYEVEETHQQQHSPPGPSNHSDIFISEDIFGPSSRHDIDLFGTNSRSKNFGSSWSNVRDEDAISLAASDLDVYHLNDPVSPASTTDISPRISFFLDFYDKVICPSVVVVDSPSNPYREHILSLASSSRSLQHAICALSACNLRMKRKQSLGQETWRRPSELEQLDQINSGGGYTPSQRTTQQAGMDKQATDSSMQEEFRHRSLAVQLLNEQLGDPSKARHDSVLATLFILCHYRMCESGIAQFRTQFAGVKKILGMRESGLETGNWGWMETLFTYFDGIAASINDRETQLRGGFLEMVANPANPNHALENLAGCDSILFKTIAKLGRLNLLSQHRPIMPDYPTTTLLLRTAPPMPRPKLAGQALVDFYNLHAHNFDGNGFASTLDDEAFPLGSTGRPHSPSNEDLNTSFWSEWKACRSALQAWEFDPSRLVSQLQPTPSPTQLRDFGYISEAFRYSALLYTERLACPNLPSSHLNFQNLVSQVLYYVTSLEQGSGAEKFLLWPLFISGSECVNELQQSIVRTKCREIMGRSGYLNNLAGLEVLEKLWAEKEDGPNERVSGGAAFRWTKHIAGVEGEWIMF